MHTIQYVFCMSLFLTGCNAFSMFGFGRQLIENKLPLHQQTLRQQSHESHFFEIKKIEKQLPLQENTVRYRRSKSAPAQPYKNKENNGK
jgi:hypothetical protein